MSVDLFHLLGIFLLLSCLSLLDLDDSVSTSEPTTIIFCGTILAEDCCVKRAGKFADSWDIVNIRDENGVSTWKKNTEEMIDRVLSLISTKAAQAEYFNNPVSEGRIFTETKVGRVPKLSKFPFLVIYADPTQSEAKGTAKNKKGSLKDHSRQYGSAERLNAPCTSSRDSSAR